MGLVAEAEVENSGEKFFVFDAVRIGGLGKVFSKTQVGIGVRFQHINFALGIAAQVDPRVAAQVQGFINSFAQRNDPSPQFVRQFCRVRLNAQTFLSRRAPFDFRRGVEWAFRSMVRPPSTTWRPMQHSTQYAPLNWVIFFPPRGYLRPFVFRKRPRSSVHRFAQDLGVLPR